jgi:hypothetical protein
MPNSLQHYEFIAYFPQRLYKNDGKPRAFILQDKNADKLLNVQKLLVGRSSDFVWPQASLPRTNKDKPGYRCTPIIDGKAILFKNPEVPLSTELGA